MKPSVIKWDELQNNWGNKCHYLCCSMNPPPIKLIMRSNVSNINNPYPYTNLFNIFLLKHLLTVITMQVLVIFALFCTALSITSAEVSFLWKALYNILHKITTQYFLAHIVFCVFKNENEWKFVNFIFIFESVFYDIEWKVHFSYRLIFL